MLERNYSAGIAKKNGQHIKDCRKRLRDNSVNAAHVRQNGHQVKRNIICFKCRQPGHIARECSRQNNLN